MNEMKKCDYCGKPIDGNNGAIEIFVSGDKCGNYCSAKCWTKMIKKVKRRLTALTAVTIPPAVLSATVRNKKEGETKK
jgi:ribosomal protein L24E